MTDVFATSTHLRHLLGLVRGGEAAAVNDVLAYAMERLRTLTRRMFRAQPDLRVLEETDDVLQKSLVRLNRALLELKPATTRAFMTLALNHVRWVLGDLARELPRAVTHPGDPVSRTDPPAHPEPLDPAGPPSDLLEWADFHRAVTELPDEDREAFDAIYYGGLSQPEAAELLGLSLRTVKRRWRSARLLLDQRLHGDWPELS